MALATALVIGVVAPVTASAQLLNGNFENNPQTGHPLMGLGYVDPGTPTGPLYNTWKVTVGDINVGTGPAGTTCQAGPLTHCIDLNGSTPGRIEQVMRTTARQTCIVSFWMSRHVSLATATLRPFINGAPTSPPTFTHNAAGVNANDGKWELHSFTFTAGPSTTLAFASDMKDAAGPQIDNVVMSCSGRPIDTTATLDTTIRPHLVVPPDPCCPPWNATTLADRMVYQGTGGIGAPYALRFQSSATLNTQLIAYMAYLHAVNPAFTTINIDFTVGDAGTGAAPGPSTPTQLHTETWNTTSGPSPVPAFFNPGSMQVNRWYTIKTRIYLNDGNMFFPDTCTNVEISVRIQVLASRAANAPGGAVLQIRMTNGKIVEKALKP